MDVSPCLWYGHLTLEQKTHGCVYTLVVWTPHRVTENTGMCWWYEQTSRSETENTWLCLHVGGIDRHLTVEQKTQGCVGGMDRHLTVEQKTHGCVYTLVV